MTTVAEQVATEVLLVIMLWVFRLSDEAETQLELSNAAAKAESHCKLEVVNYRGSDADGSISYDLCLCFSLGHEQLNKYICKPRVVDTVCEVRDHHDTECMRVSLEVGKYYYSPCKYDLDHYVDRASMHRTAGG